MSIGERIRNKRIELNMTQEELATSVGYTSKSTINKIELGINDIPLSKVCEFARALSTTESYLMGWKDDSSSSAPDQAAVLDPAAERLLSAFWDLNAEGQSNLIEYAEYLHSSGRYKKGSSA